MTIPSIATTHRAVQQRGYGSPDDVLHVAEVTVPSPGPREVLVRVQAAALDRGTWHLMTGTPYLVRPVLGLRRPRNPRVGRDVAGTVVALGADVARFAVGDEVYGVAPGSLAEHAVAREDKLALKPAGLTFAQAAAVPISAGTALQALTDAGRLQAGQRVLVLGASGGVGSYVVQLAVALGAEVTGVCSAAKADFVRSLGATRVLDRVTQDFADGSQHHDLVIDIAGNPSVRRLRRALTPTGTAVIVGGEERGGLTGGMHRQLGASLLSLFVRQRLTMLVAKERASDLERLSPLLESGQVTPALDRTYPLAEVVDAMRHLTSGEVRGKVAITVP